MSLFHTLSQVFGTAASAKKNPQKQPSSVSPDRIPRPTPPKLKQPTKPAVVAVDQNLKDAQLKARDILIEARSQALKLKEEAESEIRRARQSLTDQQRSLDQKLSSLDKKLDSLDKKEEDIEQTKVQLQQHIDQLKQERDQIQQRLSVISQMTTQEARETLFKSLEQKLHQEMATIVRQKEEETKQIAAEKAKEIIVEAMKHGTIDYVPEYTVSVVKLPDEEVKGRIIGKGGRNIHTFERATGVDVDLDGAPTEVRLSCFDPIRREIAKHALQQLIKDGRIQPSRIEEVVGKISKDLDKFIFEEGKKICHTVGVYNLPSDLISLIGRLHYQVANGQNLATHTIERTKIGVKLAKEIGANPDVVRLACLLLDLGKTIRDFEGSQIELCVKALKKNNMPESVISAVASSGDESSFSNIEQVLVSIADKISKSRPGASYDNFEEHVARLKNLEDIAIRYSAVEKAYAIQAGREVRVVLDPVKSKDDDVIAVAHSIRDEIQNNMAYPGSVKVTVLREQRFKKIAH